MKKQIVYPTLIPRLFAAQIDLLILLTILSLLKELFRISDPQNYQGSLINSLIHIIAMGVFFIGLWIYKNATPGKALLHMKIADAKTFGPPSKYQLFKRFAAYPTALLGIWLIPITKQRQALHDKIAGTVVIKT